MREGGVKVHKDSQGLGRRSLASLSLNTLNQAPGMRNGRYRVGGVQNFVFECAKNVRGVTFFMLHVQKTNRKIIISCLEVPNFNDFRDATPLKQLMIWGVVDDQVFCAIVMELPFKN